MIRKIVHIAAWNYVNWAPKPIWHYRKKGARWGIKNYNFSEKTIMIFAAKTVLYEDFIEKI